MPGTKGHSGGARPSSGRKQQYVTIELNSQMLEYLEWLRINDKTWVKYGDEINLSTLLQQALELEKAKLQGERLTW